MEQLKRRLNAQGVTYAELAARIKVSESTVKRWFSQYSFDISHLDDICNALSIDVADLVSQKRKRTSEKHLNHEQEEELALDETLFSIFYLALTGMSSSEILKRFEISLPKLRMYLIRLDHLRLIELHPGDRILPLVHQAIRWQVHGPLTLKYGAMIRQDFMQSNFAGENERDWLVAGKISSASLQVFHRKIELALNELRDFMDLDEDLEPSEVFNITFYAAHRPWKFPVLALKKKRPSS